MTDMLTHTKVNDIEKLTTASQARAWKPTQARLPAWHVCALVRALPRAWGFGFGATLTKGEEYATTNTIDDGLPAFLDSMLEPIKARRLLEPTSTGYQRVLTLCTPVPWART